MKKSLYIIATIVAILVLSSIDNTRSIAAVAGGNEEGAQFFGAALSVLFIGASQAFDKRRYEFACLFVGGLITYICVGVSVASLVTVCAYVGVVSILGCYPEVKKWLNYLAKSED